MATEPALSRTRPCGSWTRASRPTACRPRSSAWYTGCRWSEGPAWFGDGRYLLWSDIPNNRILRWDEETGAVAAFRKPSNNANGNTRDLQGRLLSCEHDARRVSASSTDGANTAGRRTKAEAQLAERRRRSPDGAVWFTDPPYGLHGHPEAAGASEEQDRLPLRRPPGALRAVGATTPPPQRALLLPGREAALRGRLARDPPSTILVFDVAAGGAKLGRGAGVLIDAGLGRLSRTDSASMWTATSGCGWGMGDAEPGRRTRVLAERRADRPHRPPGALREPVLRWAPSEPPLHGGESRGSTPSTSTHRVWRAGRVGEARRRPAAGQGVLSSSRHSCRIRGRIQPRRHSTSACSGREPKPRKRWTPGSSGGHDVVQALRRWACVFHDLG